jgi:hypothetical protein
MTVWKISKIVSRLVAAAIGLGAASAAADAPGGKVKVLPIVDAAIEQHGGSVFEASKTRFDVCSKSGCSTVSVTMNRGLFEYDVTAMVRGVERRVRSTNDQVEVWVDGERVEVAEAQRYRNWAMQRVYFNFLPYRLNDPSAYKEDLGVELFEGRELHKVKVSFEPGSSTDASDEFLYWFDPESARMEFFAYSYESGEGGLRFRRLFNHRRVGGLVFYDQENWGVEGKGLSVDLVTPEYVATAMRHISTVEMRNISVEALP